MEPSTTQQQERAMTTLADLTMSQLATAHETLSGIRTTSKSWNTKSKGEDRVAALMAERNLTLADVFRAAGVEIVPETADEALERDVAAAEAAFAALPDDEDDRPLDAPEILASERAANDVRDIVTRYLCDSGIAPEIAEGAAVRAAQALPIPKQAPSRLNLRPIGHRALARPDGKLQTMIDMMRAPEGVTVSELAIALGWAENSVRGAISGSLKKRMGLDVVSVKTPGENRVYRVTERA